jgi:hypothetical protein
VAAAIVIAIGTTSSPAARPVQPAPASDLASRITALGRDSPWKLTRTIPVRFRTYHPQGMVRIGDTLVFSSVEVRVATKRLAQPAGGYDRDPGEGVGHLFRMDMAGNLLSQATVGEGTIYHPGGIDYDGTSLWVPVAEYRPNSRAIVYRVDPDTLKASPVLRFEDHIGAVVYDRDDRSLHGVSWGSRRFYRWPLDANGKATGADKPPESQRTLNPSHYVDYQDCHYAGRHQMVCSGLAEYRTAPQAPPFRLGGLALIDLADHRPAHEVPVPLWTTGGLPMTRNPAWIEPTESGLRAYFMPEDESSNIYVFEISFQLPAASFRPLPASGGFQSGWQLGWKRLAAGNRQLKMQPLRPWDQQQRIPSVSEPSDGKSHVRSSALRAFRAR